MYIRQLAMSQSQGLNRFLALSTYMILHTPVKSRPIRVIHSPQFNALNEFNIEVPKSKAARRIIYVSPLKVERMLVRYSAVI
jgi:hypothetical protein